MQGPKTQHDIQTISELNQGASRTPVLARDNSRDRPRRACARRAAPRRAVADPPRRAVDGAKPYPYDSWPQTPKVQVTTGSDAANTVQQIEATLSPQQMQQFQQLQQQQGRRRLQQGPKTQQAITTIGELNQGASQA